MEKSDKIENLTKMKIVEKVGNWTKMKIVEKVVKLD